MSLYNQITKLQEEFKAELIAVSFYDYETETAWSIHGDRWFHAASTIKVAVLIALFCAIEKSRIGLLSNVHVRNRFFSVADGSIYSLEYERDSGSKVYAALGKVMKVQELAHHMITTSNNLATNLLLDLVGVDNARETLKELGVEGVELVRGVEDNRAFEAGINNRVTANGLLRLFKLLHENRICSPEASKRMLDILFKQEYKSGIPAGLPSEVRSVARIAHKTGNISTVAHDAGLIYLPDREPYALTILTQWNTDSPPKNEVIARVSREIYKYSIRTGITQ
jgi:beta-lactamase class A